MAIKKYVQYGIMYLATYCMVQVGLAQLNTEKGIAVQGYDVVAYFTGQPQKGNTAIKAAYGGATYFFKSESNRQAFLADPKKYVPEYGGWCAYAMGATGELVPVDPESFTIYKGRLYLFYKSWTNNTLSKWKKDEAGLKQKADNNWLKYPNK